jgi:hypothetical protein
VTAPESGPDLTAIDKHRKRQGPTSKMDRLAAELDDQQTAILKAACGITHDGEHQREWTAIAAWLTKDIDHPYGTISDQQVRYWAQQHG